MKIVLLPGFPLHADPTFGYKNFHIGYNYDHVQAKYVHWEQIGSYWEEILSNAVAYVTNVTSVTTFNRFTNIGGEVKDIGCRSFLQCLEILLYLVLHTIKTSIKAFNQGLFLSKYKNIFKKISPQKIYLLKKKKRKKNCMCTLL